MEYNATALEVNAYGQSESSQLERKIGNCEQNEQTKREGDWQMWKPLVKGSRGPP